MEDAAARRFLRDLFDAAVAAADPRIVLAAHLPPRPAGRCVVVGAGKSAAVMAAALEDAWPDVALSGTVVTRYGHAAPTRRIEVIEASHPVPDAAGEAGAKRLLERVRGLAADDLVLALISGGGSALLGLPAPGLTLADKQAVHRALLASGAAIGEMNIVRKHLSAIKGGRLALAARPARVVTLAISDEPGDGPEVIASRPTRYRIDPPAAVAAHLLAAADETPKPGDLLADFRLIAAPMASLRAAAALARAQGVAALILGDALEGEAREMGSVLAGVALGALRHGEPLGRPCVLLSGGEATVTIGAGPAGRGGRNTEFLLSLALALGGAPGVWAMAGDTDGIDGTEDAAGAIVAPDTLFRARTAGLDPRAVLEAHDSYSLFDAIGDLIRTGPTLTNVNDVRALLVA
jgi:glycerate-2-kinase